MGDVVQLKVRPRWRYRMVMGALTRYSSSHDRSPQVWRGCEWEDLKPVALQMPAPGLLQ